MAILFAIVMVHVLRGSKLRLVVLMVALLIVSCSTFAIVWYCDYLVVVQEKREEGIIVTQGISIAIATSSFNLVHHLLAWQYKMLSVNIPHLFDSVVDPDLSKRERAQFTGCSWC